MEIRSQDKRKANKMSVAWIDPIFLFFCVCRTWFVSQLRHWSGCSPMEDTGRFLALTETPAVRFFFIFEGLMKKVLYFNSRCP